MDLRVLRGEIILKPQQFNQLILVEADHRFAVDQRHGRALKTGIDQFLPRSRVSANILFDKLNALLR